MEKFPFSTEAVKISNAPFDDENPQFRPRFFCKRLDWEYFICDQNRLVYTDPKTNKEFTFEELKKWDDYFRANKFKICKEDYPGFYR